MKMKIIIFIVVFMIFGFSAYSQNRINGYADLAFGTSLDDFIREYTGFNPVNPGTNLSNKGVIAYRRIDGGRLVNILFFENKFYQAVIQYMNPTSRDTTEILQNYINQFGRPNNTEEIGGRNWWIKSTWNINERFTVTAFVQAGVLEIKHFDPVIASENDILL